MFDSVPKTLPSKPCVATLAALLFLLTSLPALTASVETSEAFVRRVYARYRTSADSGVPMDRPGGIAFYTAALLDAFAKDSELAHGEVGAIDSDPICGCQLYGDLRVKRVAITSDAASKVEARVNFDDLASHETVILTLSRTAAGWLIADVGHKGMRSIMAVLQESIAHPFQPDKSK